MASAQDRRTFLRLLGLGLGVASSARLAAQPAPRPGLFIPGNRVPDLATLVRTAAGIGFREVELGPTTLTGADFVPLRKALDGQALTVASRQVPMPMVFSNARVVLNDCRILGTRQVVCQEVPEPQRAGIDGYKRVVDLLNPAGKITQSAGVQLVVRVHRDDLRARGGVVPLDYMLAGTSPSLVKFEFDVGDFAAATRDPLEDFTRYKGRFASVHVTDGAAPNLAKVLATARTAGVQHVFIADPGREWSWDRIKQTFGEVSALKL